MGWATDYISSWCTWLTLTTHTNLVVNVCKRPFQIVGGLFCQLFLASLIESLQRFILIFHCCFVALALELECRGFLRFALTEVPPALPLIHFAPLITAHTDVCSECSNFEYFITFQSCDFLLAVIISVVAAH